MTTRLLLILFVLIFAPASAFADVYRWTDANGVTVFSSSPPEEGIGARNVVIVAKEKPRVMRGTRESAEDYASANQQILMNRIDSLERQVQAQQYAQAVAAASQYQPAYSGGYYATPAPSYYSEPYYDPYSYPYYGYYPYTYPSVVVLRSGFGFRNRVVARPFVHGTFGHSTFGHGTFGRPAVHGGVRGGGFSHGGRR